MGVTALLGRGRLDVPHKSYAFENNGHPLRRLPGAVLRVSPKICLRSLLYRAYSLADPSRAVRTLETRV